MLIRVRYALRKGGETLKYITLLNLTPMGREHLREAKDILIKVTGVTEQFGGKLESVWATVGQYDFVAVAEYPNPEVAFKARIKLAELGYFVLEGLEAFDIEFFLATRRARMTSARLITVHSRPVSAPDRYV